MRKRRFPGRASLLFSLALFLLLGPWLRVGAAQDPQATPRLAGARAKSPEESAAFERFMREQDPAEQIRLVEDFLLQYPDTELKEYAFQAATQAYQAKNDFQRVLTYGELTLAENADNLTALLILASTIPERITRADPDREEKLAEAERYAKRSLNVLAKLSRPPRMVEEQWTQTKQDTEAPAHAALGLIALIREDFVRAELEFKEAVALSSRPDPVMLYRLGLCYSFQKKYDLALEALERASSLGGVKIAGPEGGTRDLVGEAKEFTLRAKSFPAPPLSETPAASGQQESSQVP